MAFDWFYVHEKEEKLINKYTQKWAICMQIFALSLTLNWHLFHFPFSLIFCEHCNTFFFHVNTISFVSPLACNKKIKTRNEFETFRRQRANKYSSTFLSKLDRTRHHWNIFFRHANCHFLYFIYIPQWWWSPIDDKNKQKSRELNNHCECHFKKKFDQK